MNYPTVLLYILGPIFRHIHYLIVTKQSKGKEPNYTKTAKCNNWERQNYENFAENKRDGNYKADMVYQNEDMVYGS